MSKKILSLALALIMALSVCAIAASALDLADGTYGFKVESTATPGQKDGTVTVTISYQFPKSFDASGYLMQAGSNTCLCYDNTKYEYDSYEWLVTNSSGDVVFKYNDANTKDALFTTLSAKFTTADTTNAAKYGWNGVCLISSAFDTTSQSECTSTTGAPLNVDANNEAAYLQITFNVLDELTANSVIGISEASVTQLKNTKMMYRDGNKNVTVAPANLVLTDAYAAPKAAYKVFDGAVKIRKNAADNTKYDLGFTGSFEDFDPEFAESGTSATIKSVGCEVTINGVTNTYTDRFVYEGTTYGKYAFRVAVGAFGPLDTTEVSIRMFVELNEAVDGQTKFYSEGITTTMNEQIQARDS